jgi:hydrogenase maturation protein HypF
VTGVVQGVGFRPFVHRLAQRYRLSGWVRNAAGEVRIRVEGEAGGVERFVEALRGEAPPLARVDRIERDPQPAGIATGFAILESVDDEGRQPVPADVALCRACEAELFDPADRRHSHPFITCTDCGPRYTLIEAVPYDRERTSMRAFAQCPACAAEYATPESRRYHLSRTLSPVRTCALVARRHRAASRWRGRAAAAAALLEAGGARAAWGRRFTGGGRGRAAVARPREQATRCEAARGDGADPADAAALANLEPGESALLSAPERPIVRRGGSRARRSRPAWRPGSTGSAFCWPTPRSIICCSTGCAARW